MNNIISTNEIKLPYRCLIRENAYFWIVNVDFQKDGDDLYEDLPWEAPIQFFAYELDIDGHIFKFHSKRKFVSGVLEFNSSAHGSAKALDDSKCTMPLHRAITLARWCLKEGAMGEASSPISVAREVV